PCTGLYGPRTRKPRVSSRYALSGHVRAEWAPGVPVWGVELDRGLGWGVAPTSFVQATPGFGARSVRGPYTSARQTCRSDPIPPHPVHPDAVLHTCRGSRLISPYTYIHLK